MSKVRITPEEAAGIQEYYESPVPAIARRPAISIFAIFIGMVFLWSNILPGGIIGAGLSFSKGMWAIVSAMAIFGAIAILQSLMAQRTGLTFGQNCRYIFGHWGTYIVQILSFVIILGWFGACSSFFGDVVAKTWGVNYYIPATLICIVFVVIAYYGYKPIAWVAYVVGAFCVAFSILILTKGVGAHGGWDAVISAPVTAPMAFGPAVLALVGCFAHGVTTTTQNFCRYSKNPAGTAWAAGIPWTFGIGFMFFIGAVAIRLTGNPDIAYLGESVGLVVVGAVLLLAMTFTTLDTTVYSASLDLSAATMIKRTTCVLIGGVIGLLLTEFRAVDYIINLLVITGLMWPPVAGAMIAHFWILHKGKYIDSKYVIPGKLPKEQQAKIRGFPISSAIALGGGFLLAILSNMYAWIIPPPGLGFLAAFVLQLILTPLFKEKVVLPEAAEA